MARCARAGATEHMCSGRTFLWDSRALRTARTHALFKQLLDVELKERAALALPLQIIGLYGILLREHCAEYRALYVLGARKRDIRRLVVRESLLLGASGASSSCRFALTVGVLFSPALQSVLRHPPYILFASRRERNMKAACKIFFTNPSSVVHAFWHRLW